MTNRLHYPQAEANAANTHVVENMPPILENYNMFAQDEILKDCVLRGGAKWAMPDLTAFGRLCGSAEHINLGIEANRIKPVLNSHDRYGQRIDQVDFHPAYHQLMAASTQQGLTGSPWAAPKTGAHVRRAAGCYMLTQVEAGHGCPITMSFAAVPTLQKNSQIAEEWIPKVLAQTYDPRNVPHMEKTSVTIGMADGNTDESSFMRLATPIGKYWVCKRQVGHAYEAMEVIGGSAVMENSLMPRFYRDAPINSIWEGSGNVQCLDALRAMQKDPSSLTAFLQEVNQAKGGDSRFDQYLTGLQKDLNNQDNIEYRARALVEKMALSLQGSLLLRHGSTASAEAFCAGRLQGNSGNTYGMLPPDIDCDALIGNARITQN
jgi:hypothetical protein